MEMMTWQDWGVAVVAVVVAIILVRRVWRFFACGERNACDGCTKECNRRK